jgi:hypothetical protein
MKFYGEKELCFYYEHRLRKKRRWSWVPESHGLPREGEIIWLNQDCYVVEKVVRAHVLYPADFKPAAETHPQHPIVFLRDATEAERYLYSVDHAENSKGDYFDWQQSVDGQG